MFNVISIMVGDQNNLLK